MNILKWLQDWYALNCDGDWEHCYGIQINTLDNPGWMVDIDLIDTYLENKNFEKIKIYVDDNNWIDCSVSNDVFRGRCSVDKLEQILKIFSEWATANSESNTID